MKSNYLVATALPLCLLLSACGGGGSGGGGGVNSIPPAPPTAPVPPPPTPPPPPPPPPPPIDTSTAEFGRSEGIAHANAASAYSAGATGQGITVGIIDSGIDTGSAEFAGRISAASQDVAGNRGLDDIGGHGTSVTGVLGAARNDLEIVGMAFDATLLVLRTDEPGSCANVDPDEGCTHSTSDIARGIDIAIQNNARVVNISLGGGDFTSTMRAAIGRAAAAGVVVVISAGNDSAAQPDPLSLVALTPEANGHVIIAGSVGQNDVISDFSNRAGTGQAAYLAALGERVRSFDHEGTAFLFSGTSYSTPQITGAVALLAQAFPNLGGGEIVQLLFQTARDAGAAGDDAVYGQGILDLFEAFQPQGQTVLAGSNAPVDFGINATLSAPMGDARQSGLGAVILDGYDRAFAIDLASSVQRAIQPRQLANALSPRGGGQFVQAAGGNAVLAFSIDAETDGARIARLALRGEDVEAARVAAGIAAARLDADTSIALAFSQSGESIVARLAGQSRPAFMVARDASGDAGLARSPETGFAVRHVSGSTGFTAFGEAGDTLIRDDRDYSLVDPSWRRSGYRSVGIAVDHRWGALRLDSSLSYLDEEQTVLGARFGNALGNASGAQSVFTEMRLGFDAGNGWSISGAARHGWSFARGNGDALTGGEIRSFAASADLSKRGVMGDFDMLSLRIAQPLRVYAGGLTLTLPTSYDYATLDAGYSNSVFNLAPQGRQIDVEAAYAAPLGGGWVGGHLFYRRDPRHIDALPDDIGAAIRFTLGF